MQTYTGAEYLMIDCANAYGHDKWLFEDRIKWVRENVVADIDNAEQLAFDGKCDVPVLFLKAVKAIRAAMNGEAIGHMVEFDATTSGPQIMSALTCDKRGALITNLTSANKRYDCYTEGWRVMEKKLKGDDHDYARGDLKDAIMTHFYGSKMKPIEIFGEETEELSAFYKTMAEVLPGASDLRDELIELWQEWALDHTWTLPDGHVAHVKVFTKNVEQIEIDELDHHKFSHTFFEHEGKEAGVSLAANVIHSIDAFMVREICRRCNYDKARMQQDLAKLKRELEQRGIDMKMECNTDQVLSLANLKYLRAVDQWNDEMLLRTYRLVTRVLKNERLDVVCIHDAFKGHANHIGTLRYWYKEILAEFAESNLLGQIFSEIEGYEVAYDKLSDPKEFAAEVRKSNYAIC